ncbi:carboxylesterase family protein [Nonomuraea sp. SBT364]|uniref:carboxylesterase family protein n=1 Tax=Nonomuraea sp. SBT364 TaxID=1580530 RepID=UPI0012E2FFE5
MATTTPQQAGLRRIRHRAAAFGGDPRNVTLFGEPGGAFGTCAQLTSPTAGAAAAPVSAAMTMVMTTAERSCCRTPKEFKRVVSHRGRKTARRPISGGGDRRVRSPHTAANRLRRCE